MKFNLSLRYSPRWDVAVLNMDSLIFGDMGSVMIRRLTEWDNELDIYMDFVILQGYIREELYEVNAG
jgi:hypothetical protein